MQNYFIKYSLAFFHFTDEVLLEPILLGTAIFWFLPHFQIVFNNSDLSVQKLFEGLWTDMINYPYVYIPFILFFIWWIISSIIHRKIEAKEKCKLKSNLDELPEVLKKTNILFNQVSISLDNFNKQGGIKHTNKPKNKNNRRH